MRSALKFALNGSFVLALIGLIGIPSVLIGDGVSTSQLSPSIAWYAGFKNSAPRWPFLLHTLDPFQGLAHAIECNPIGCPAAELTEIEKRCLGHVQPISGEPQGPFADSCGARAELMKLQIAFAADSRFTGQILQGFTIDTRGTTILFFLIWSAVLGAPGFLIRIALWMKVPKEDEVQISLK
ncbi:MAG: hypothetical protein WCA11_10825 [Terracidiphilus sp.]